MFVCWYIKDRSPFFSSVSCKIVYLWITTDRFLMSDICYIYVHSLENGYPLTGLSTFCCECN
jgi:hypothetical protein